MEFQLLVGVATAFVLAFAYIYRYITSKFDFFEKRGIEGPKPSFPFGTWKGAWKKNFGEDDLEKVGKFGHVFGTFDGRTPNLIISDPGLIRKILVDEADKFRSHRAFRVKQKILHNSLLAIEGKESKELKKLLNIALSSGKINKLLPRISKPTETLVDGLLKEAGPEKSVNITERISNFITDALAFSLFAFDLSTDESIRVKFDRALTKIFTVDNPESMFSVTPFIFESLGSLDNFILRPAYARYLAGVTELVIDERQKNEDIKPEGRAVDLVDLLMAAAEEEKQIAAKEKGVQEENLQTLLTKEQLVTVCMEVILTVGSATRSSLALSVHTLANHSDIQEKLYSEIYKHLQNYGEITFDFIQKSEYLDMFLGEILRIYPTEFRLERNSIEEVKLDDATIPEGTLVSIPIYAIHHSQEHYPEPEKFNPERFSSVNTDKRNHYTYMPFGQAGSNSANIGIQLGVLITKLAIVSLVTALKFSPNEKKEAPEFVKGITGVPRPKPIWVKVEKRD